MFVQHQLGSVFIPSFFQHCLSFLCGTEMLKLHFSDVGSLEVRACRQVSAGRANKEGERKRDWEEDEERKKADREERARAREISHSFSDVELNLCRNASSALYVCSLAM